MMLIVKSLVLEVAFLVAEGLTNTGMCDGALIFKYCLGLY